MASPRSRCDSSTCLDTRQALSNPYTGVLAIFASRLLNGNPPLIFEDGQQMRDFVSVYDIAQACRLAMEVPDAPGRVFNIGSGRPYTVLEIARADGARCWARAHRAADHPEISRRRHPPLLRRHRAGAATYWDIEPRVSLEEGLIELAGWLEGQAADDRVAEARAELDVRGLAI